MTTDFEKKMDMERQRERQDIVSHNPMSNLMPLLQWVVGAGIFVFMSWLIISAINDLDNDVEYVIQQTNGQGG